MNRSLTRILCCAALSAWACVAFAQNSPPQPPPKPPPFPTPLTAPSADSPQKTTNATAQAEYDYHAALAKCDAKPQSEHQRCQSQAEEHFYNALAGTNPGEEGNTGSSATETGK